MTRYDGGYANRPRGMRRQAEPVAAAALPPILPTPRLAPTEATRRWAALLQQIVEVDPLACPTCRGPMRILACVTQASVIDQILTHLRARPATAAHAGERSPHRRGPPGAGARHAPHAHPTTPRRHRSPTVTAVPTAREARERHGGYAAACHAPESMVKAHSRCGAGVRKLSAVSGDGSHDASGPTAPAVAGAAHRRARDRLRTRPGADTNGLTSAGREAELQRAPRMDGPR